MIAIKFAEALANYGSNFYRYFIVASIVLP